jgi:enamine deaminase RidA (YjgF/YER057c/UK114 family)
MMTPMNEASSIAHWSATGRDGNPEACVTLWPQRGEDLEALFIRLAEEARVRGAEIAAVFVYGAVAEKFERACKWPVTWIECAACDGSGVAGVQALTWSGGPVQRLRLGGRVVGTVAEDATARHCWLGGVRPQSPAWPRAAQVEQMFGEAALALDLAGFELRDVVRTWFYNDEILAWYPEFNAVRTAIYRPVAWRSGSLPASTGIGAVNRAGAALEVAWRAWRPKLAGAEAGAPREVASPLQCPAPAYGSSFSRAMEVPVSGGRWLTVSGTASIHPDGRTAWVGDCRRQVDLTMEVIAAILAARGLRWSDVSRATAYFRHAADAAHLAAWQAEQGWTELPIVATHSVVCRDELLFELEVDAVSGR